MDLSQESKATFGKFISAVYWQRNSFFLKRFNKFNIGCGQYRFLLNLYLQDGITQEELSSKLMVDKATTARAIKKLEEEGYVSRSVLEEDKRAYKIMITEKSLSIKKEFFEILDEWENEVMRNLSVEEKKSLLHLLEKIASSNIS
ncbi:MarR family winged helix-turn-helix transcriptional regulator [Inconstantimicrobium mannanitabidum]|uniref:Uncharacterized protein n=1 Tax=Inconstantimicrobium mannanitabidum TaxID=1604901 RepID=A0ACB5RHT8_9CLOT|nr:MarR family transcriptional regulator [Clostridium sp. TW13]GKX68660.1 hypothetical protein rsdtw13_39180 [Clostridium sp. TW13]